MTLSSNAEAVGRSMVADALGAETKARATTRRFGQVLVTTVQAHASGRPGPRAVTGDYRRSIGAQHGNTATQTWADVGTNRVQGRRLEFGFWGLTDSLGRTFHQPAYPHFGPGFDKVAPAYAAAIAAIIGALDA